MKDNTTGALLLLVGVLLHVAAAQFPGQYVLSNSIMSAVLNGAAPPGANYPCITQLSVEGQVIVPPIAVGALFQMDVRSAQGDNYNPTQSGACAGAPSNLSAWMYGWTQYTSVPSGVLMGVVPRTFLSSTGGCTDGVFTPYYFNWGVQMGSGSDFPEQAMIIVQTYQATSPSAPAIMPWASELPTIYYDCDFAATAWYMPSPDFQFVQIPGWPGAPAIATGYGHMMCNADGSLCAGTYTANPLTVQAFNNGAGGCPFAMVNNNPNSVTNDMNVHSRTVIFAVGNQATVQTALLQTAQIINSWGDV